MIVITFGKKDFTEYKLPTLTSLSLGLILESVWESATSKLVGLLMKFNFQLLKFAVQQMVSQKLYSQQSNKV